MSTADQEKKIEEQKENIGEQKENVEEQKENKSEESKEYQEQPTPERLPVGELKWSQKEEEKRLSEQLAKEDDASFSFAEKEVSATALKNKNLEDTLTPIDFKEYPLEINSQPAQEKKDAKEAPQTEEQTEEEEKTDPKKKWIKILWYPALLIVSLFTGAIIGHSVIADQPVSDVFNIEVWKHLFDLIYG